MIRTAIFFLQDAVEWQGREIPYPFLPAGI